MLTKGKLEATCFNSVDGNPFKALAQAIRAADVRHADGLKRTKAARDANAARRAKRDA